MNILFITNFARKYSYLLGYVPLGILHLSSVLKSKGHNVDICNASCKEADKLIRQKSISVVGYSSATGDIKDYLELNRLIKSRHKVFSLFGGMHPTFYPEMVEEEGVDAICRGEGESAMLEMIDTIEKGGDITGIKNWWVKDDNKIYKNELRPLIGDLDSLPYPDRNLFFKKFKAVAGSPRKTFMATRGCPYRCSYCFNAKYNQLYNHKNIVRRRSVTNVIEEILAVTKTWPTQWVHFLDDTFILDNRWLEEFSAAYSLRVKLPFYCNIRADLVDEGMISMLKKAGCGVAGFGLESGSSYVRNKILKRNMATESIVRASELLNKYKIRFLTFNMVGIPGEKIEDSCQTVHLNHRCRPTYAYTSVFQPYPGTAITKMIHERGLIDDTTDGKKYQNLPDTLHGISVLKNEHGGQIENLHRLFAILTAFPFLKPAIPLLIKLPFTPFYEVLRKLWASYAYRRLYYFRLSFLQVLRAAFDAFAKKSV